MTSPPPRNRAVQPLGTSSALRRTWRADETSIASLNEAVEPGSATIAGKGVVTVTPPAAALSGARGPARAVRRPRTRATRVARRAEPGLPDARTDMRTLRRCNERMPKRRTWARLPKTLGVAPTRRGG